MPEDGLGAEGEDLTDEMKGLLESIIKLPPGTRIPDIIKDQLQQRTTGRFHIVISPSYREERILGLIGHSSFAYILSASGTTDTDDGGKAVIDLTAILGAIEPEGSPLHHGADPGPEFVSIHGPGTVPGAILLTGLPIVVANSTGDEPVVFTATPENPTAVANIPKNGAWRRPTPGAGNSAKSVLIQGFDLNGAAAARKTFGWHLTVEFVFVPNYLL